MNNFSNFSSIHALSAQLEMLAKLPNLSNPFQFSESALSAIQHLSSISDISDINSNLSAMADHLSFLSKLDIPALTSGITFGTDTVKITPQAKKTLDSLQEQFSKENANDKTDSPTDDPYAPPSKSEYSESSNVSTKEIVNQDAETDQFPSPSSLPKENTNAEIYELPATDFNKKYQSILEKVFSVLIVPFMIAYIFRTDITPLTNVVTSFFDEYIRIETQKTNDRQEDRKLLNSILDAIHEGNELQKKQLEINRVHNELLKHQLETNHEYQLCEESVEPNQ